MASRERVLDAAESVFVEVGYDAATNLIASSSSTRPSTLSTFRRRRPATAALLRGALGVPDLIAAGEALRLAFVEHIEAILTARRPGEIGEHTRFVAEITSAITLALLERAQAEQLHRCAAVQAELKRVLLLYLRSAMAPAPSS